MNNSNNKNTSTSTGHASARQLRYAALLQWGTRIAFLVMIATYILYVTGIVEPHIPRDELIAQLNLPKDSYLANTGAPTEHWAWVPLMEKGDFLNYAGILILTLLTIVGILTLIPSYLKDRNWIYATIVSLELIVLLLAASGVVNIGGH